MGKIFVSTPAPPNVYPHKDPRSRAQLSYFIFNGLKKHFGENRVIFGNGSLPLQGDDILVAQLLNKNLLKWKRSIVISNDNFDVDKWKFSRFRKYGMNHKTLHHPQVGTQMRRCLSAILTSNDPAIHRWNNNDKQVLEKKQWLLNNIGNIIVTPHPIDKNQFTRLYNPDFIHDKPRIVIYHTGWLKYGKDLINLLKQLGYKNGKDYGVIDSVDKTNDAGVKKLLRRYTYLGHTSVSETGGPPYFAAEFLCQGLVLFGNEEWWDGLGHRELCWTYDPKRKQQNINNIRKLMDKDSIPLYHKIRKDVMGKFLARKDNEWDYYLNILIREIEKYL